MSAASSIAGPGKDMILVIEDDRALREGLAMNLRLEGYEIAVATRGSGRAC